MYILLSLDLGKFSALAERIEMILFSVFVIFILVRFLTGSLLIGAVEISTSNHCLVLSCLPVRSFRLVLTLLAAYVVFTISVIWFC